MSKYCRLILHELAVIGHASNNELLARLRTVFPELSATTVHRATARLAKRGLIATAPKDTSGVMRYDSHTKPHDHFMCEQCGRLKDVDIADELNALLRKKIADCGASSHVTIYGICAHCKRRKTRRKYLPTLGPRQR